MSKKNLYHPVLDTFEINRLKLKNGEAFRDFEVQMILPKATLQTAKAWFKQIVS